MHRAVLLLQLQIGDDVFLLLLSDERPEEVVNVLQDSLGRAADRLDMVAVFINQVGGHALRLQDDEGDEVHPDIERRDDGELRSLPFRANEVGLFPIGPAVHITHAQFAGDLDRGIRIDVDKLRDREKFLEIVDDLRLSSVAGREAQAAERFQLEVVEVKPLLQPAPALTGEAAAVEPELDRHVEAVAEEDEVLNRQQPDDDETVGQRPTVGQAGLDTAGRLDQVEIVDRVFGQPVAELRVDPNQIDGLAERQLDHLLAVGEERQRDVVLGQRLQDRVVQDRRERVGHVAED